MHSSRWMLLFHTFANTINAPPLFVSPITQSRGKHPERTPAFWLPRFYWLCMNETRAVLVPGDSALKNKKIHPTPHGAMPPPATPAYYYYYY